MKLPLLVAAGLLVASPWAVSADEHSKYLGLNEYRHVKPEPKAPYCGDNVWEDGNYFLNDAKHANRLFAPNADTLTIKLKGAFFDYAPERSLGWNLRWVQKQKIQVGIFADITQMGDSMSAPGAAGIPGRLVFFSDDHQSRQRRIPDINTNVYGPVLYGGGGLGLKFSILEFDKSKANKLTDSLLQNLADLGSQTSAGVPPYLQAPLTSLFQAALEGAKSKDDLFGQITFVLDDRNGSHNAATSPLRTGDIVFVRQSDRAKAIPWKNLCYKPTTGEVFQNDEANPELPPILNYVTISLVKNAGADAGRIQDALTYERLVSEMNQRNTDTGLISSMKDVTAGLQVKMLERELFRQIDVLGMEKGSVSDLERHDAAAHLSKVLYANGLAVHGFDPKPLAAANRDCAYLEAEKITPDMLGRLHVRLARLSSAHFTRERLSALATTIPTTCQAANTGLQAMHDHLYNPK